MIGASRERRRSGRLAADGSVSPSLPTSGRRLGRRPWKARRPVSAPFAHASEAEMSRILDFYGVRWEYEPHTFPILWNLDGDVVESFAPDFFLPDLDLYLELTTLRQKLVRKKNRKLRRLRELYPDVNIKLFYARDFRRPDAQVRAGGADRRAVGDVRPGGVAARRRLRSRRRAGRSTASRPSPPGSRRAHGTRSPPRPLARPPARRDIVGSTPPRAAMSRRPCHDPRGQSRHRRRRGPPDRGRDRAKVRRARAPGSAPTTPAAG